MVIQKYYLIPFIALLVQCIFSQDIKYSIIPEGDKEDIPVVQHEKLVIDSILKSNKPIRQLENLDKRADIAQQFAINDSNFTRFVYEPLLKANTRCEIFNVSPLRENEMIPTLAQVCGTGECYRIDMFNFAQNITSVAIVAMNIYKVVFVNHIHNTQADIPYRLQKLAVQIALGSKEVSNALGYNPKESDALMAGTKTALNRSRCERSQHLCVAPTFIKNDKALWAVVDLTDLRLVGIRWTNVGDAGPIPMELITQRRLENKAITECYCKTESTFKDSLWDFSYMLTSSDGLRISNVNFNGKKIIENAKLVDWHVSYSNTDGFGYSDAIGCPFFSTAAVIAVEPPRIIPIFENGVKVGFTLQQNFNSEGWPLPCNYNYCQKFEFYNDGRFRMACASLGRGCGNNGTYRPVMRIVFSGENQNFFQWKNNNWAQWNLENWNLQNELSEYSDKGFLYKLDLSNASYMIEPGRGQFNDKGKGDNAYMYVTRLNPDREEGEMDLPTIGPCCNLDYQQGPEKFMLPSPEGIHNSKLALWYVPQMKNDDTKGKEYCWADSKLENGVYSSIVYPCFAGPMFIPNK